MPAIPIAIIGAVAVDAAVTAIGAMTLAGVGAEVATGAMLTEVGVGAAAAGAAEGAVAAGIGETLAGGLAGGLAEGVAGEAIGGGLLSSLGAEAVAAPMELMAEVGGLGADAATSGFASSIASPVNAFVGNTASSLTPLADSVGTSLTSTVGADAAGTGLADTLASKGTGLLDWANKNKMMVGMGLNGLGKAYSTKVQTDEQKRQFNEKMSRTAGGSMPSATWKNGA